MRPSIFLLAGLGLPLLASGCVTQHRYDAVVRQRDDEQARRLQVEADLGHMNAALAAAQASLDGRERALAADQTSFAEWKLLVDRTTTERDDAAALVEQLRGELARVGTNLKEYSAQKVELERSLADAEARARRLDEVKRTVQEKVLLMRDLSAAASAPGVKGMTISVVDGYPTLRFEPEALFDGRKDVSKSHAAVLRRVAEVLAPKKDLRVQLEDLSAPDVTPEDRISRLQKVTSVLSDGGIDMERLGFSVASEGEPSPSYYREGKGTIELSVRPSGPTEPLQGPTALQDQGGAPPADRATALRDESAAPAPR